MAIVCIFASCSKDQDLAEMFNVGTLSPHISLAKAGIQSYYGIEILGDQPFEEPTHGLPNLTRFKFLASNQPTTVQKIYVVFTATFF